MVVDISEITLDNLYKYQPRYKEKKLRTPWNKGNKESKSFNIKEYQQSKQYKEYQHNYYLRVTKLKRQKNKMLKLGGLI